jgi:hypothetical protein
VNDAPRRPAIFTDYPRIAAHAHILQRSHLRQCPWSTCSTVHGPTRTMAVMVMSGVSTRFDAIPKI